MNYKQYFPVFQNRKDMVYLDSAASSLKPKKVSDAITDYYNFYSGNIERGVYPISFEATAIVEKVREKIALFINASKEEVIFTRGCTDSLNTVALSLKENLKKGDEIITTELEHHSSFLPWLKASEEKGAVIKFIPLTEEGKITVDNFKKVLSDKTKIVAISHVSNVMGYLTPVKEIIALSHIKGAIVSVDGAQAAPHMKIDVKDLDADFYSFSFHKMCGPTGLGVLYGKKELLNSMEPVELGGEMNDEVSKDNVTYKNIPYKFEAGTMPIAEIFGAGAAIDFLNEVGFGYIEKRDKELSGYAKKLLRSIPEIVIYNDYEESPIIAFNIKGIHSHDAVSFYSENNVCLRAGLHCAEPLHKWLNITASLRASFYFYNDESDVEKFIFVTKKAIAFFKEVGYLE
ncbi:MAG: cysteine desulfurase [Bacillales bacterium]|nr:cysteine desulfurase [Bacillales bacterium]